MSDQDQYRLRAGITTGRLDADDLGTFDIRDGECVVEDYETAADLVDRHRVVEWPNGDPGAPEPEPESDEDAEADAEIELKSGAPSDPDFDADSESEDEDEDEKPTCAGNDGACSRAVSEPGDYCWQHDED